MEEVVSAHIPDMLVDRTLHPKPRITTKTSRRRKRSTHMEIKKRKVR